MKTNKTPSYILINRLKNNTKPMILLTQEEQDFIKSLPNNTLECLQNFIPISWSLLIDQIDWKSSWNKTITTLRIKKDYISKPKEQEYTKYRVIIRDRLGIIGNCGKFFILSDVINFKNFHCVYYTNEYGDKVHIEPNNVANYKYDNNEVFVEYRKED